MLLGPSRPVQGLCCFLQAAHHEAIALGSYGVGLSSLPHKNVARTVTLGFVLFSFSPRKRIEFWIVDQDSLDTRFCDYFAVPPDD